MKPPEFKSLKKYKIEELTPYQFRVESVLDLYPKRQRYHNIRTQERGHYIVKELPAFVEAQLKAEPEAKPKLPPGRFHRPEDSPWWTKAVKS